MPVDEHPPWRAFAADVGLLFQIVDDLLDGDGYVSSVGEDGARASRRGRGARAMRSWWSSTPTRTCSPRSSTGSPFAPRETSAAMPKKRLDVLLVERGLAESRAQAQALVMAGRVPGHSKPGEQVDEDAPLEVEAPPPYVSRAGHKLANALDAFGIDVAGLDASTSAPRPAVSPTCCCSAARRA